MIITGSGLFKMGAYTQINRTEGVNQKEITSIKYQVLCEETAMVGVVKQKKKATGELEEYKVTMEKKVVKAPEPHHPVPMCRVAPSLGARGARSLFS